jgi:hypothetical protein
MRDPAQSWECLLARLFVDAELLARFKRDPQSVGREFGLDESALAALADADWVGLDLAARSYSHKRTQHPPRKCRWWRLSRGSI